LDILKEDLNLILRHIPIGQRSGLSEILQRHSKLKIVEAENAITIEKIMFIFLLQIVI